MTLKNSVKKVMITQIDIYLDPEFYVELKNVDNRYYSSLFHFGSNA